MKTSYGIKYYLLYGVILSLCLLYYRFPTADVKSYITSQINTLFPASLCNIKKVSYKFPYSLQLDDFTLRSKNNDTIRITVERLYITPLLRHFFNHYVVTGELYQGELTANLKRENSSSPFTLSDITISKAQLSDITKQKLSGEISIRGKYQTTENSETNIFTGSLILENGKVMPSPPILTLQEIDLNYIKLSFSQINNRIDIYSGQLKGAQLDGTFAGSLSLNQSVDNILLQGTIVPQQKLLNENDTIRRQVEILQRRFGTKGLPFKLEGRTDNPIWAIKR